ncbi:hypothetical protein [Streptomonospora litoralis]|uniref:Uncharacterized protein n=1 Tax=Streptomonospora litoralis TaxID=2498135 RepID=A0A4P6Q827_9ACTN|nr:hypothetical protein [Streptomonospora litoralis]QBI56875.1 hypothetical protein EKD16_25675 [Streptomonospora litoralis]
MIARVLRRLAHRPELPETASAAVPPPEPMPSGEVHAVISEASVHLDEHELVIRDAHEALDRFWDTGCDTDYRALQHVLTDAAKKLGKCRATLARTQRRPQW